MEHAIMIRRATCQLETCRVWMRLWMRVAVMATAGVIPPATVLHGIMWTPTTLAAPVEDSPPRFSVPGHDREMRLLEELFNLHRHARTSCALWDAWLPMSTLWPAQGEPLSASAARDFYRQVLLSRRIDAEGYADMAQHRGLAHSWGWPFPTWQQAGGRGWHFSLKGDESYAGRVLGTPLTTNADGWTLEGCRVETIDKDQGLVLLLDRPDASIETPPLDVDALVAPFIRLEWQLQDVDFSEGHRCTVEWTTGDHQGFSPRRRVDYEIPQRAAESMTYAEISVYRHPLWRGRINRLRIRFRNGSSDVPQRVILKSLITAIDSRHPITGSLFVQGSCDYFNWTNDLDFLRANIDRMRKAIQFSVDEFAVRPNGCVLVPWVGHDGRKGFVRTPNGEKRLLRGHGVGNNYWDLLPFGHKDCLATIYLLDAIGRMADLECAIVAHSKWEVPAPPEGFSVADLRSLADHVRHTASSLFWNDKTQRFVACIDADGKQHDYGFTFVNLEAIHYGFASEKQARMILDWIDGKRIIPGDTSTGPDIYHWRFAPRATTRRNIDWYVWAWHDPESIPWGGQVQDGGAVLGFSYYDLMARLKVLGPDNAWQRLAEILDWFEEVQSEGGYRAYYAKPGRGTLQGGGTPGGLGIDHEFMESVLVPQVMLYGFLGFQPRPGGFALQPRLHSAWPSLTVTGIHVQDCVVDVKASADVIEITSHQAEAGELLVELLEGDWIIDTDHPSSPRRRFNVRFDGHRNSVRFVRKPV